jgi:hypothetical protein
MTKTVNLINSGIDNDATKLTMASPIDCEGNIIWPMFKAPMKDVWISFIDPEGKYLLVRRYNTKTHWGDCEIPTTLEYELVYPAMGVEKEKDEKVTVSTKSSLFKREGKS